MDLIGSLVQAGASIFGNIFSAKGQSDANKQTAQSISDQEAYQTQMSNTAWQRGVADMKAAGINPLYGATPASSPTGASMTYQNPQASWGGFGQQVGSAVSTYNNSRMTTSNIERNTGTLSIPGLGQVTIAEAKRWFQKLSAAAKATVKDTLPDVYIKVADRASAVNNRLSGFGSALMARSSFAMK